MIAARVIKIKSTPATLISYFKATTADDAIKQAIADQSRLAAQRVREIA